MRIVTVVGSRPQFIKAAAMSRVLRERHQEILVHTGQHYDYAMSGIFFQGLELPPADVNLGVGSSSHGIQTGDMLRGIEGVLIAKRPDLVLVYGDTNSTLAGALAAAKVGVPVAHVEAGLRSFNRRMPEEINRVVTDHLAHFLFCPSQAAVGNLASEGIERNVHLVGDIMLDILRWTLERSSVSRLEMLQQFGLQDNKYLLATVHRSENTNDPIRLTSILQAFDRLDEPVVFPVHPRTTRAMSELGVRLKPHIRVIEPVGYAEMVNLSQSARMILTDSGGLQKEAYWLGVPCLTLRDETEWVETLATGWNRLVGTDTAAIVAAANSMTPPSSRPKLYGDGGVPSTCIDLLEHAQAIQCHEWEPITH